MSNDPLPSIVPADDDARKLLAETVLTIAAFRRRLRDAGYPFREPPAIDALLARVDDLLFPDGRTARNGSRPATKAQRSAIKA